MKICCISDIHSFLPEIPECDLLLISGDICPDRDPKPTRTRVFGRDIEKVYDAVGSASAMFYQSKWLMTDFKEWLDAVPAKHVVACWGNHDYIGERRPDFVPSGLRWKILTDQLTEIDGLKIWGTPWQPWFYDWAFNSPPRDEGGEEFLARKWSFMPDDTDIIVVHGPPAGFGDTTREGDRTGSFTLVDRIKQVKPKLVVCGHIHEGYGEYEIMHDNERVTKIVNASIMTRDYKPLNKPIMIEL